MEEKNIRELTLDEMDKVIGGKGELYNGMEFNEMDALSKKCAREGHCPNCDSEKHNRAWRNFKKYKNSYYRCDLCKITIYFQ